MAQHVVANDQCTQATHLFPSSSLTHVRLSAIEAQLFPPVYPESGEGAAIPGPFPPAPARALSSHAHVAHTVVGWAPTDALRAAVKGAIEVAHPLLKCSLAPGFAATEPAPGLGEVWATTAAAAVNDVREQPDFASAVERMRSLQVSAFFSRGLQSLWPFRSPRRHGLEQST